MDERVVVNIDFEGDETIQNVLQIPYDITWADFELLVKLTFDVEELRFMYLDEENEEIVISSEEEFLESLRVAKKCNNTMHLKLKQVKPPPIEIVFEDVPDEEDMQVNVETDVKSGTVMMSTLNEPDVDIPIEVEHEEEKKEEGVPANLVDPAPSDSDQVPSADQDVIYCGGLESTGDEQTLICPVIRDPFCRFKKFFVISSKNKMVLDVEAWGIKPGTRLVLYPKKGMGEPRANQLFYEDTRTGTIRSCFNDLCIDVSGNHAVVNPYELGKTSQQWMINNFKVHHRFNPNWVLTVRDNAELHAADFSLEMSQRWRLEYCESQPGKDNVETGEKSGRASQAQNLFIPPLPEPPRPCKQRVKGYYAQLAREMGRLHNTGRMKSHHPRIRKQGQCSESGELAVAGSEEEDTPPAWFFSYMDKFKAEITEEISKLVARKTVHQVLRGLEGAVVTSVRGTSGLPAAATAPAITGQDQASAPDGQRPLYCHYGVVCDNCEQNIVGARFKCGNCEDFDLCEQCENIEGVHDPDHVFIKIRRPTITAGRRKNGKLSPLLKKSLYKPEEDRLRMEDKAKKEEKKQREMKKKMDRLEKKEEHREEKQRRREEKLKRRLVEQRERPLKKERLDLPQFQTLERMDSEFVSDANFPDGTHVQPCTRITKRWVLRNKGTHCWTSGTKLKLMWGNMACVADEVSVPYIEPGQSGTLAVELVAPEEPGVYQSHWRLHHHGNRFGHRVWCSIVVDPREVLEPDNQDTKSLLDIKKEPGESQKGEPYVSITHHEGETLVGVGPDAAAAVAQLKSPTQDQTTKVVDADILTAQDILSFEMLDIRERNTPKVSQTATPNNTPLDVSPPKSPAPELEDDGAPQLLSSSSSVELVSEASCEDLSAQMTELVQERIAALGLKPDVTDDDIESISSCSSEGNESDSDFYIVPLPDCFNPNFPPSTNASTSVIVPKDQECRDKSLDEILTASNSIETQPLLPSVRSPEPEASVIQFSPRLEEPEIVHISADVDEEDGARFEDAPELDEHLSEAGSSETEDEPHTDHNANVQLALQDEHDEEGGQFQPLGSGRPKLTRQQSPSPGEIAQTVLTTAIGVASHCAASAYSTAKDVFKTLQAKDQYVPPGSNWTPPKQVWTPPKQEWTPPAQDWTPPKINWTPPKTTWTPPDDEDIIDVDKPSTPMEQLIEMGFADREINQKLLDKHDGDLPKVIQELIQLQDSEWHQKRH